MQLIIQPCVKDDSILCELIQAGDRQAKQELCIKYQSLVRKYARAYLNVYGNDLDVEDLEQMGYLGLLIAAEKYDFSYQKYIRHICYLLDKAEYIKRNSQFRLYCKVADPVA